MRLTKAWFRDQDYRWRGLISIPERLAITRLHRKSRHLEWDPARRSGSLRRILIRRGWHARLCATTRTMAWTGSRFTRLRTTQAADIRILPARVRSSRMAQ